MSNTTTQSKKQLPCNVCFQVLSFVWRVGIGLWLVPSLVHQLGRSAYGLIPIAGIMTQYVSIISQSISSAASRFLAVALQRDDTKDANRVFSTGLTMMAIGKWFAPSRRRECSGVLFDTVGWLKEQPLARVDQLTRPFGGN